MFKFTNNPILKPHQVTILKLFFESDFGKPFFLTGGTALAAFYFGHRYSKDLDFFTLVPYKTEALTHTINSIAQHTGSTISVKVKSGTYNEIYLAHQAGWTQRIDIVKEQPRRFGKIEEIEGIRIDSLENIGSNKVLTVFGRLEPKDYIDLYLILTRTHHEFNALFELAKQKDLGLTEFYFANALLDIEKITVWPEMKIPFNTSEMILFYKNLSREMFQRIKPKE
jgi:predicted nucleotidyltransferase component of viral defense system